MLRVAISPALKLLLTIYVCLGCPVAHGAVGVCVPGNTDHLSSDRCPCSGGASAECIGSCVSGSCTGATSVDPPICAPPGNLGNLSADGCPCNVNGDCAGDCASGFCTGSGTSACVPTNILQNTSPDGCPCVVNGNCTGDCDPLTRTCAGLVGQVQSRQPTISGLASADVDLGGAVIDTATLGNFTPSDGTVTFRLFGPNDTVCFTVPVFTSQVAHDRATTVVSSAFAPTTPGTYRFIARYVGNAWNLSATTSCANAAQAVNVTLPMFSNGFE